MSLAQAEQATAVQGFSGFVDLTRDIWTEGGWLMIPLFGLAVFIFFEALSLVLRLDRAKLSIPFWWFGSAFLAAMFALVVIMVGPLGNLFLDPLLAIFANPFLWLTVATYGFCRRQMVTQETWEAWLEDPSKARGHVGDVVRFVAGERINEEAMDRLDAVRSGMIPGINQKITVLSSLVTLAPLMGLLGTVIGMLDTFRGLGSASGQAAELVADGIRVALITTQTGLTIAIPGYIFIALAVRSRKTYAIFLTELESAIVRRVHHRKSEGAAA
ncbi:MAG: MotA/TolQ/ExbB proton channel family protein [Opitutales bacterium]